MVIVRASNDLTPRLIDTTFEEPDSNLTMSILPSCSVLFCHISLRNLILCNYYVTIYSLWRCQWALHTYSSHASHPMIVCFTPLTSSPLWPSCLASSWVMPGFAFITSIVQYPHWPCTTFPFFNDTLILGHGLFDLDGVGLLAPFSLWVLPLLFCFSVIPRVFMWEWLGLKRPNRVPVNKWSW